MPYVMCGTTISQGVDVPRSTVVDEIPMPPQSRPVDRLSVWAPKRARTLGKRISQARREKALYEGRDIDQIEIADAVGVTGAAVSRWESDQKSPRDEHLIRLADYLGVTPAWLRYGVEPKRPYQIVTVEG
jgi:DNA-binding XRE family transcriptional regulator